MYIKYRIVEKNGKFAIQGFNQECGVPISDPNFQFRNVQFPYRTEYKTLYSAVVKYSEGEWTFLETKLLKEDVPVPENYIMEKGEWVNDWGNPLTSLFYKTWIISHKTKIAAQTALKKYLWNSLVEPQEVKNKDWAQVDKE